MVPDSFSHIHHFWGTDIGVSPHPSFNSVPFSLASLKYKVTLRGCLHTFLSHVPGSRRDTRPDFHLVLYLSLKGKRKRNDRQIYDCFSPITLSVPVGAFSFPKMFFRRIPKITIICYQQLVDVCTHWDPRSHSRLSLYWKDGFSVRKRGSVTGKLI